MNIKMIIVAILSALTAIILYKNREESSFWLFGDIKTSKLILLSIFYVFGIITGAILFRKRSKHPKEYAVSDSVTNNIDEETISDEDRDYVSRDL